MSEVNLCSAVFESARRNPQRLALRVPRVGSPNGQHDDLTYEQLMVAVGGQQTALRKAGLKEGDRVLLFTAPGMALYTLMLAMLALGVVPVMIERGMPRDRLRAVLMLSGAKAVIGDVAILKLWWLFPALWLMKRWAVDGRALGVSDWRSLATTCAPECVLLPETAHGIITYTSGSTGLPKGADRTHGSLIAQHHAIRGHWPDQDDDIDLPSFPVLVLHNLSCGITTVMPDADLAYPGRIDAAKVLSQVTRQGITRLTGSPAYLQCLTQYAQDHDLVFPSVRAVAIGGSTLTLPLAHGCKRTFPQAQIMVVYGSTEAEPISEVLLDELLADWSKHPGHLVGRPASGAEVCIVDLNAPLNSDADVCAAWQSRGDEGEILVAGTHVLSAYVENPEATRATKIPRPDGLVWHRTGDTGFFDQEGRLWLTGRVRDRVTIGGRACSPFPLEKTVDAIQGVERCALMEHQGTPVLIVQGQPRDPAALSSALSDAGLSHIKVIPIASMPVDMRHNSKLDRPTLRVMLEKGLAS